MFSTCGILLWQFQFFFSSISPLWPAEEGDREKLNLRQQQITIHNTKKGSDNESLKLNAKCLKAWTQKMIHVICFRAPNAVVHCIMTTSFYVYLCRTMDIHVHIPIKGSHKVTHRILPFLHIWKKYITKVTPRKIKLQCFNGALF